MAADLKTADGKCRIAPLLDEQFIRRTVGSFRRSCPGAALTDDELISESYAFLLTGAYRPRQFSVAKSTQRDPVTALKAHAAVSLFHFLRRVSKREARQQDRFVTGLEGDASGRGVEETSKEFYMVADMCAEAGPHGADALVRREEHATAATRLKMLRTCAQMDWTSHAGAAVLKFFAAVDRGSDLRTAARYAGLTRPVIREIRARYGAWSASSTPGEVS